MLKRTWDFQGADDENIIPRSGDRRVLGRPFPDFDAVLRTYAPNYSYQQFRSVQFLYTKNFARQWGMNANYWYGIAPVDRRRRSIRRRDTLQFLGFTEDELTNDWVIAAPPGARLVVRAAAIRRDVVGVLHLHARARAPTC